MVPRKTRNGLAAAEQPSERLTHAGADVQVRFFDYSVSAALEPATPQESFSPSED